MAQASMIECKLGAFWCGPPVNTVEILLQRIRFVAPVSCVLGVVPTIVEFHVI